MSTTENIKIVFKADGSDVTNSIEDVSGGIEKIGKKAEGTAISLKKIGVAILGFAAVKESFTSSVNSAIKMQSISKKLAIATGDVGSAMADVSNIAKKYGLELSSTADAFAAFAVSTKGTVLEGDVALKVFDNVSAAVSGMGLNAEASTRVFKALEQMMSKGKVSAEELRGQLGDAGLAGAFGIAARSAGLTTGAFDKLLSTGKIMSADFIPKFAAQLKDELGQNAAKGADTLQGSINSLNNTVFTVSSAVGDKLTPSILAFSRGVADAQPTLLKLADGVGFVVDNFAILSTGLVAYKVAVIGAGLASKIAAIEVASFSAAIAVAVAPITIMAAALAGVTAGIVYFAKVQADTADQVLADANEKYTRFVTVSRSLTRTIKDSIPGFGAMSKAQQNASIHAVRLSLNLESLSNITTKNKKEFDLLISSYKDGISKINNKNFDGIMAKIRPFSDSLSSIGINLDDIAKKRDYSSLQDAANKLGILQARAESVSKKFADSLVAKTISKSDKIVENIRVQRESIVKIFGESSSQVESFDSKITIFNDFQAAKRNAISEKEAASKAKSAASAASKIIEQKNREIDASEKAAERDRILAGEKQLRLDNAFSLAKSRLENNTGTKTNRNKSNALKSDSRSSKRDTSLIANFDANIADIKSFNERKNSILNDQFDIEKGIREAAFVSEVDALGLKEQGKEDKLAEFRALHLENEAAFAEEKRLQILDNDALEIEQIDNQNILKQDQLAAFREQGASITSEFADLSSNITNANFGKIFSDTGNFIKNTKKLWQSGEKGKLSVVQSGLGAVSKLMDSHNRRQFEIGKAAAIANATISTIEGASNALSLGFPLGIIAAGIVTALGVANVAKIASTPFNGGGSPSSGSTSVPSISAQQPVQQTAQPASQQQQASGANVNLTIQALDPASLDETTLQQIGDKLAPVLQNSFNGNQNFSVT